MHRGKDKISERQELKIERHRRIEVHSARICTSLLSGGTLLRRSRRLRTIQHFLGCTCAQWRQTVKPMQSLMKTIFEPDQCWMRGNDPKRCLFAAMGVAVHIAHRQVQQTNLSTRRIKTAVSGVETPRPIN
jgi:hypothetical protein